MGENYFNESVTNITIHFDGVAKGKDKMRKIYHKEMLKKMGIAEVIHNDDATIVILKDGRKGVAVRDKSEDDYPAFGFAMAYAYAMGTDGSKTQFKKNMKKIIK